MSEFDADRFEQKKTYNKYLLILSSTYILALLTTLVLANRPILFNFGDSNFYWPGGMFIFPLVFVVLDITTETYGAYASRVLIYTGFVMELVMATVGIYVSHMESPSFVDEDHIAAYQMVFDPTIRFVISSLIAALSSELINNYLMFKWKIICHGRWFVIRSVLSTAVGQAILTIIVDLLAFSGTYPPKELLYLMLDGYLFKTVVASLMVVPSMAIVRHLKARGIDSYEAAKASYNPFATSIPF